MRSFIAGIAAVSAALVGGGPAFSADYGRHHVPQVKERRGDVPRAEDQIIPFSGQVSVCDAPGVLNQISRRFAHRESRFWDSPLTIERFEKVHEVALRPWGEAFIPRRFCTARAVISDGYTRTVHYSVREALGPIGIGSDVQWCIVGLDRNLAFAPACRAALP